MNRALRAAREAAEERPDRVELLVPPITWVDMPRVQFLTTTDERARPGDEVPGLALSSLSHLWVTGLVRSTSRSTSGSSGAAPASEAPPSPPRSASSRSGLPGR